MAKLCIPKEITSLLKKNIPASAKRSLALMDEAKRNDLMTEIVDAFDIDAENKALLRAELENQVTLKGRDILNQSLTVKTKSSKLQDNIIEKVKKVRNLGGFNDGLIQDVTEVKLGVALTPEEAEQLVKVSDKISTFVDANKNIDLRQKEKAEAFGKAFQEYTDTISNITNSSFGEKFVSTGNANLLLGAKSAITNIISNSTFGGLASVERTATMGSPYKINEVFKKALDDAGFYSKYKFDKTRAEDISGNIRSLGEVMVQFGDKTMGEKFFKEINNFAYQTLLSTPDQFFASFAKTDTIYRLARNQIKKDNPDIKVNSKEFELKFNQLTDDAFQINPLTPEGKILREKGINEANRVTFQEDSGLAKISTKTRKMVDDGAVALASKVMPENLAKGFKLGTFIVPFSQTPGNVIKSGIDYSGLKLPYDIAKGIKTYVGLDKPDKKSFMAILDAFKEEGVTASFVRSSIGFTTAVAIASLIDVDNYIGLFPQSQRDRELLKARKATTNSIKIGDTWVSLDYLGPIGAPLIGVLELKKNWEKGFGEALLAYGAGAGRQLGQIPMLQGVQDTVEFVSKQIDTPVEEVFTNMYGSLLSFATARAIPTIVPDIGEAFDPVERDTKKSEVNIAGIPIDPRIVNKIPGWRTQLEERTDVFGIPDKNTGPGEIFFGARVSVGSTDKVISTLQELAQDGYNATPTDMIKNARSFTVPKESYNEERNKVGEMLYQEYAKIIDQGSFAKKDKEAQYETLQKAEEKVKKKFKAEMEKKYGKIED